MHLAQPITTQPELIDLHQRIAELEEANRTLQVRLDQMQTKYQRLQETLRQVQNELEQWVEEHTADIAARQQSEHAMHESEQRFRAIFESAAVGIAVVTNNDQRIAEANAAFQELLGYTQNELRQLSYQDFTHPDDLPAELTAVRQMIVTGRNRYMIEKRYIRKDGAVVWVRLTNSLVCDNDGQPYLGIAIVEDITERRCAEQALTRAYNDLETLNQNLSRSRNLLRALFDGLKDGLMLLDGSGTVQTVNRAMAALLQQTPADLIGQQWSNICPPIIPIVPDRVDNPSRWRDDTRCQRLRYHSPDGTTHILDIHLIALRNACRAVEQIIVHVMDVTETLQLQVRAIENERFAASGRLAATVAHEINTPLLSLDFSLEMAQIAAPHERDTFLADAREEIQRIARIVRQLLDIYRPTPPNHSRVDINTQVKRVLLLTGKWVRDQAITIEQDLAGDLPLLVGRADEVLQILLNLIMNAVQAMPNGGTLRIQTRVQNALPEQAIRADTVARPCIMVTIADNGCGIHTDVQKHIFEPFVTTREDGTGLGLAICQQIVRQYSGTIMVQSEPDHGSIFTVILPLS